MNWIHNSGYGYAAIPCIILFVRRVLSEKLLAKEEDEDDITIGKF
jgi:hypothetical protein